AGYPTFEHAVFRDALRVVAAGRRTVGRRQGHFGTLVPVTELMEKGTGPHHAERDRGPCRQAALDGRHCDDTGVQRDLGEVELAPGAGVLAPPGHALGVLQHQVMAFAVLVDDEEVADRDRAAVLEHQLQVVADAFEARDQFRPQLEPDDAGLLEDDVACFDGHGVPGGLMHDLCGHGYLLDGWSDGLARGQPHEAAPAPCCRWLLWFWFSPGDPCRLRPARRAIRIPFDAHICVGHHIIAQGSFDVTG